MPRSRIVYGEDEDDYVDFVRLDGQPQFSGMRLMQFERPGRHGLSFLQVGRRGSPFDLVGFRDFDTLIAASQLIDVMRQKLQGRKCTIWDSTGSEYADLLCLDVLADKPRPLLIGVGGMSEEMKAVASVRMTFVDPY
jgi:hypothetical protein